MLTREQDQELEQALFDFVIRVLKGKTTSETELQILPEVVETLLSLCK